MPLYEYACLECLKRFEALVLGSARPACPKCGGHNLEKLVSTFAVGAGGGRTTRASGPPSEAEGPCGSCGDPRGPGSCATG
ncbi:MAG TPA: zinc ribbon domain-containing protein [Candidatus Polarisedimenticolia bacterium]|jgi:putative FmdB family regulatory protein|nr:zinc ribbon domain-containing protein [Candidatus Polarisedimenticolia bacterium]